MDSATTQAPQDAEPTPAPATSSEGSGSRPKRQRKPLSAEARQRATDRQAINRKLEDVFSSGDTEAIARTRALLEGRTMQDAARAEETLKAMADAPTPPSTPSKPTPPPGWPTDEATAMARPLADGMVQALAMVAGLWGVDLARPRVLGEGAPPVVFTEEIAKASAPVVAKYAPDFLTTPEGMLGATLVTVISVCVMEAVKAKAELATAQLKAAGAGTPAAGAAA